MQPNILLIVLDSVRKDHLSCYGHDRPTSQHIDQLAGDAVRYTQAIAAAPSTPPSHASMFTGLYPSYHGVFSRHPNLDPEIPLVAEGLSDAGYATFGFSNSYHTSKDRGFSRGFDYYHDILDMDQFAGRIYELSREYLAFFIRYFVTEDDISYFQGQKFERKIEEVDAPFFGFINFNSAHIPYDPPRRFKRRFEDMFDDWNEVDEDLARDVARTAGDEYTMGELEVGEVEWELSKHWYDGEIAYMDELVASIVDRLKQAGMYDDTMIVVTSDHGEHFGEHGLAYHKFSLSEILINVPLIVKFPDGRSSVSDELVSLTDLAPTMLDIAGADVPDHVQGRSVISDTEPEAVFAETGRPDSNHRDKMLAHGDRDVFDEYDRGLQAVRTDSFKLVRDTRGEETLYDITDTEREVTDEARTERLTKLIEETLRSHPEGETDEELDEHVEDHLRELGYIG